MLGNALNCDVLVRGPISEEMNQVGVTHFLGDLDISSKALLQPVLEWIHSNSWKNLSDQEVKQLCGIQQQLLSCGTERYGKILSRNLYNLAMDLIQNPTFGPVAQEILQVLSNSNLSHAEQASHQLNLLKGKGGSFSEYYTQAIHRLSYAESYGPLAIALASTSLMGRGVGTLFKIGCRGTRLTGLGLELAGGMLKTGVESLAFPLTSALGNVMFGQPMGVQNYWGEAWYGAKVIFGLNLGRCLGKYTYLALHGMRSIGEAAARFRSLSRITKSVFPLSAELGVLTTVGYFNGPGELGYHLAESLGTMLHLRGAQGLNTCLLPGVTPLMQRIEGSTYEVVRGLGRRAWRGWSIRGNHTFGFGRRPKLAMAGRASAAINPQSLIHKGPGEAYRSLSQGNPKYKYLWKKPKPLETHPNSAWSLQHAMRIEAHLFYHLENYQDQVGPLWNFDFTHTDVSLNQFSLSRHLRDLRSKSSGTQLWPKEYKPAEALERIGYQFEGKNEAGKVSAKPVGWKREKLWLIFRLRSTQNPQIERYVFAHFKNLFSNNHMEKSEIPGKGVGWEVSLEIETAPGSGHFVNSSFFLRETHPDYTLEGVSFLEPVPMCPPPRGPRPGTRLLVAV